MGQFMTTFWAAQDKVDDEAAGVKSTALLFGGQTKACLSAFTGAQLALLSLTGTLRKLPVEPCMVSGPCRCDQQHCARLRFRALEHSTWL